MPIRRFGLLAVALVLAAGTPVRTARAQCSGGGQLTFTFVGSTTASVGAAYNATLDIHGGDGQTILTGSSGLPPGLTAHASPPDIVISGTPTQPGSFPATVTAFDVLTTFCGVFHFTITVVGGRITIAPSSLRDGVVGVAYSQQFTAAGSGSPFTFALIGALPPGLTLSGDTISGTPTQAGFYPFGISASGSGGATGRADYLIAVTDTPAPRLEVTMMDGGTPWGLIPYGIGASGPSIGYTVTCSNLGTGPATGVVLHLLLDGVLGCGASNPGRQQAKDLPLADLAPGASLQTLENDVLCISAVQSIVGTDAEALSTYQLVSQASATSSQTDSNTSVVVTPYCNNVLCTTFCPLRYLTGYPCPEIGITPGSAAALLATSGAPFQQTFQASSGTPPYSFSASGLPDQMAIDAITGVVSGTPSDTGRFEFTVGVEDSSGNLCHAEQTYALDVCPGDGSPLLSPRSTAPSLAYRLPDATRETAYQAAFVALCGTPPYAVSSPTGLPAGLSLVTSALPDLRIQGTPSEAGDVTFDLLVTDAQGHSSRSSYTVHVAHCALSVGPDALPPATLGQHYMTSFQFSGGTPPYTVWDIQPYCGVWDCGLFRDSGFRSDVIVRKLTKEWGIGFSPTSADAIEGTPTQQGDVTFTIVGQDSSSGGACYGARTYTLQVRGNPQVCPTIGLSPEELPPATAGVPYSARIFASGGSDPYRFGADELPATSGLSVDDTGLIAGTPAAPGTLTPTVFAQDQNVCIGARQYALVVAPNPHCQPIYLSPQTWDLSNHEAGTLPPGTVGVPYNGTTVPSDRISGSGGSRPYTYNIPSMPDGLNLSIDPTSADLSGMPTQPGTYLFTITATDSNPAGSCSGSFRYKIVIQPGQLSSKTAASARNPDTSPGGLVSGVMRFFKQSVRAVRTVLRDLNLYYQVRDQVLGATPGGRELTRLYYRHSGEITSLLKSDATLRDQAFATIEAWEPQLRSLVAGVGSDVRFTQPMSDTLSALLARLKLLGSASLQADIAAEQASIGFPSWVGLSMDEARQNLDQRPCVASDATLCLNASRFRVDVEWQDFQGRTGAGHAVSLSGDTGYFWFFSSSNVELIVKALDGRAVNGNFWIFYGALSDVAYTLSVTDTVTGLVRTYSNPSGQFASVGDTSAFAGSGAALGNPFERSPLERPAAQGCTPGGTSLCLGQGRFQIDVAWTDFQGNHGAGQPVSLTSDTGYFWFFNASNVELVLKVLDGRAINGHFWVFYGALSDVAYTVTVTDTLTGAVKTYTNTSGTFASVGDTTAF